MFRSAPNSNAGEETSNQSNGLAVSFCVIGKRRGSFNDLGSLFNPLLLGHWLVANDVVTDGLIQVLHVAPLARSAVLEPRSKWHRHRLSELDCEPVQAINHTTSPAAPSPSYPRGVAIHPKGSDNWRGEGPGLGWTLQSP